MVIQTFPYFELVDLLKVDPTITLDIPYARNDNFLGFAVYSKGHCFLHPTVANAVKQVHDYLKTKNLYLKVFDGYRPLHVQQLMWDLVQDDRYISNPAINKGRHTRGTAIDLTLIDANGCQLAMPSEFDEFSERAHSDYKGALAIELQNRAILTEAMAKYGFVQYPYEWWHFDYNGWQDDEKYPPLDISFEKIVEVLK